MPCIQIKKFGDKYVTNGFALPKFNIEGQDSAFGRKLQPGDVLEVTDEQLEEIQSHDNGGVLEITTKTANRPYYYQDEVEKITTDVSKINSRHKAKELANMREASMADSKRRRDLAAAAPDDDAARAALLLPADALDAAEENAAPEPAAEVSTTNAAPRKKRRRAVS